VTAGVAAWCLHYAVVKEKLVAELRRRKSGSFAAFGTLRTKISLRMASLFIERSGEP
jgi:hypothetical protein